MLRMISNIPCSNTIHHFLNNSCNIIVGSSRLRETVHCFFSLLAESIVSRSIGTLSHGATSLRSCHQPMLPSQPNDCLHSGDISGVCFYVLSPLVRTGDNKGNREIFL